MTTESMEREHDGVLTITRIGNSAGLRIPAWLLKARHLEVGHTIPYKIINGQMTLDLNSGKPRREKSPEAKARLQQLMSRITTDTQWHEEVDYGVEGDELI